MITARVELSGVDQVMQILARLPQAIDAGVEDSAKTMRVLAQGRTAVDTGRAKRSWGQVEKNAGGFSFTNPVWYTTVLEEGGYYHESAKVIEIDGKFYSRQSPGGILWPLLEDDTVIRRVAETIVREIQRGI